MAGLCSPSGLWLGADTAVAGPECCTRSEEVLMDSQVIGRRRAGVFAVAGAHWSQSH